MSEINSFSSSPPEVWGGVIDQLRARLTVGARLVLSGAPHPGSEKKVEIGCGQWDTAGLTRICASSVAAMADPDSRYPRSSIEDDFNYGSCVASASLHIRMGTWQGRLSPGRPHLPRPRACAKGAAGPRGQTSVLCSSELRYPTRVFGGERDSRKPQQLNSSSLN